MYHNNHNNNGNNLLDRLDAEVTHLLNYRWDHRHENPSFTRNPNSLFTLLSAIWKLDPTATVSGTGNTYAIHLHHDYAGPTQEIVGPTILITACIAVLALHNKDFLPYTAYKTRLQPVGS